MYYKIYEYSILFDGEERTLFYTPNHYRALVARDKLIELGHKQVFVKEFTLEEQALIIMRQNRLGEESFNKVKFLLENSIECIQ